MDLVHSALGPYTVLVTSTDVILLSSHHNCDGGMALFLQMRKLKLKV